MRKAKQNLHPQAADAKYSKPTPGSLSGGCQIFPSSRRTGVAVSPSPGLYLTSIAWRDLENIFNLIGDYPCYTVYSYAGIVLRKYDGGLRLC